MSRTRRWSVVAALSLVLTLAAACERGENYLIVNESEMPIVLVNSRGIEHKILAPGERLGIFMQESAFEGQFPPHGWRVLSLSGVELSEHIVTWNDVASGEFRIVIR